MGHLQCCRGRSLEQGDSSFPQALRKCFLAGVLGLSVRFMVKIENTRLHLRLPETGRSSWIFKRPLFSSAKRKSCGTVLWEGRCDFMFPSGIWCTRKVHAYLIWVRLHHPHLFVDFFFLSWVNPQNSSDSNEKQMQSKAMRSMTWEIQRLISMKTLNKWWTLVQMARNIPLLKTTIKIHNCTYCWWHFSRARSSLRLPYVSQYLRKARRVSNPASANSKWLWASYCLLCPLISASATWGLWWGIVPRIQ